MLTTVFLLRALSVLTTLASAMSPSLTFARGKRVFFGAFDCGVGECRRRPVLPEWLSEDSVGFVVRSVWCCTTGLLLVLGAAQCYVAVHASTMDSAGCGDGLPKLLWLQMSPYQAVLAHRLSSDFHADCCQPAQHHPAVQLRQQR
jgi:hypothetical protein